MCPKTGKRYLFRGSGRLVLGLVWPMRTCRVCGLGSLSHRWLDGSCALEGMMWTQCAGGGGGVCGGHARGRGGDLVCPCYHGLLRG